jgi:hypothetical protein
MFSETVSKPTIVWTQNRSNVVVPNSEPKGQQTQDPDGYDISESSLERPILEIDLKGTSLLLLRAQSHNDREQYYCVCHG